MSKNRKKYGLTLTYIHTSVLSLSLAFQDQRTMWVLQESLRQKNTQLIELRRNLETLKENRDRQKEISVSFQQTLYKVDKKEKEILEKKRKGHIEKEKDDN